jgi:hypothetical protein
MNKAVIIAATEAWSDAMKIKLDYRSMIVAIGALLIIGLSPVAISATTIFAANVTELDGKAFAVAKGGVMRRLKVNDRLYEQERVITSRKASTIERAFQNESRDDRDPRHSLRGRSRWRQCNDYFTRSTGSVCFKCHRSI